MSALNFIPLMASHWQTYLTLLVVGLVFTGIYFIVFRFLILKFDFKTPGREDDEEEIKKSHNSENLTDIKTPSRAIISSDMKETISSKRKKQNSEKDININKTLNTYTENNKNDSLLINLINEINSSIYNSIFIENTDKDFLNACFNKLKLFKEILYE